MSQYRSYIPTDVVPISEFAILKYVFCRNNVGFKLERLLKEAEEKENKNCAELK